MASELIREDGERTKSSKKIKAKGRRVTASIRNQATCMILTENTLGIWGTITNDGLAD